jgi:hypothetical protein
MTKPSTATTTANPSPDEQVTARVRRIRFYTGATVYRCFPLRDYSGGITTKTSITFTPREWQGECEPQRGQVVNLSQVYQHERGLRAGVAEPV